jgi:hypothetical protein
MTKLLSEAFDTLRKLPDTEQDRYASLLLREIEEDRKWDQTSVKHADKLRKLADQATADDRAGLTEELDPDKL